MASSNSSDEDFDDLDLLLGGEERVGSIEDVSSFTTSNTILSQANVLTNKIKRWMKKKGHKPKDIKFFKNRKTLQHKGIKIFDRMERWYVQHVLKAQFKDMAQKQHAQTLMLKDPVGVEDPPKDDDICWKSNPITTTTTAAGASATRGTRTTPAAAPTPTISTTTTVEYTQTPFLITLKHCQRQVYIHMRSVLLHKFTDKDAKTRLEGFIEDLEKERVDRGDMNDDNRFDLGIRVEWTKIKEFILEKICVTRMGSHQFMTLFTTMRQDDQSVLTWIKEIRKLHEIIVKQGNHWEAIVKDEVVPALAIWITEPESKVIMGEIHRKDLHKTYTSWETLTRNISLEDLRKLVQGIETKLWPKTFKRLRHKEALAKTLVPYAELQAAVTLATEKGKRLADELKRKLTEPFLF